MSEKGDFIFHSKDWHGLYKTMTYEQLGMLVTLLADYSLGEDNDSITDPMVMGAWLIIKPRIEAEFEHYEQVKNSKVKAGKATSQSKKAYADSAEQNVTKKAYADSVEQNVAKKAYADSAEQNVAKKAYAVDNDIDKDTDTDNDIDNDIKFKNKLYLGGIISYSSSNLNTQSDKLEKANLQQGNSIPIGFIPPSDDSEKKEKNISTEENHSSESKNINKSKDVHNIRDQNVDNIPTFKEVEMYCLSHNFNVDAESFYTYYNRLGWRTKKGDPVYDWQSLMKKWDSNNSMPNNAYQCYQTDKEKKAFNGSDYLLNIIQQEHRKKVCANG